jgi:16S rRNA processing protein RimM
MEFIMTKYLEIGQIVNHFGIKGMVKIKPFTDDITRFDKLETIYIETKKQKKEYKIEEVKYHKNMVLMKLEGINTVEEAETLRQSYLLVDREKEEPLEEGVYYIVDLLGLEVYTEEEKLLGKVEDIFNTGSNDIYVVKDELGKQILLPGIPEVLKNVDLEKGKITVHLIPGLM